MTTEDQIAGLLAQAEPLRLLPDEEAEAQGLPAIVDAINALRAKLAIAQRDGHEAEFAAIAAEVNPPEVSEPEKRKPGRPKKAE
jgi:hypothetical protein